MLFRPKFKDKVDNTVAVTYKHYEAFKTEGFVRFLSLLHCILEKEYLTPQCL